MARATFTPVDEPTLADPARPMLDRIVIGLDFSEASRRAVEWTVRHIAPDAEITLVHAISVPEPPAFLGDSVPGRAQLIANARIGAAARMRELIAALETRRVRSEIEEGDPERVMLDAAIAHRADVIVLGPHGEHAGLATVLGSTAQRIAGASSVPVLVARGLPDGPPRCILAAVGDVTGTDEMLAWASFVAQRFHAPLILLHVVSSHYTGAVAIGATESERARAIDRIDAVTRRWLQRRARASRASVKQVTTAVAFGDPAAEILTVARRRGAELIVVGRGRAGRLARVVLGSISDRILRRGDRPILVVPAPHDDEP